MEEETSFRKLKKALLELLRGYPNYIFYGKIEYFLDKNSVNILENHEIIEKEKYELEKREERDYYRLTPKGVDLAISMINLENSEKTSQYNKSMNIFTIWIIILTIITASPIIINFLKWIISQTFF